MKLIVGLGNPGQVYQYTRHNLGFRIVDSLANSLTEKSTQFNSIVNWDNNKKHSAKIFRFDDILLVKPNTFMNNSGNAVQSIMTFHKISPNDLWVIQDDKDINLGEFKIHHNRGSAGHNGIKSITDKIGTQDYKRWRVGIKPPLELLDGHHTSDFVLEKFNPQEEIIVTETINNVVESILSSIIVKKED